MKRISIWITLMVFILACSQGGGGSGSGGTSGTPSGGTTTPASTAKWTTTERYHCATGLTGFDTCNSLHGFTGNGNYYIAYSARTVSGSSRFAIDLLNSSFTKVGDFAAVLPGATTSVYYTLMDTNHDNVIFHSWAGLGTGVSTVYHVNMATLTMTPITLPTTGINATTLFFPILFHDHKLYGMAQRLSDGKALLYVINLTNTGAPTISEFMGLHDNTTNTANWRNTIPDSQIRYSVKFIGVIGDLIIFSPHSSTDVNGDGINEHSEIYWVNKHDNTKAGHYNTGNVGIQTIRFTQDEVYYSYVASPQYNWKKISQVGTGAAATGQQTEVFPLSASSPTGMQYLNSRLVTGDLSENFREIDTTTYTVKTKQYPKGSGTPSISWSLIYACSQSCQGNAANYNPSTLTTGSRSFARADKTMQEITFHE
ncbi:hypothetical protein [Turneriella parva]|uniref:Lipoprotein n=1 Tax=Turneriella parva (strain ATCC BAA-1111 / DSM 21527 / NCTC 11395 / H) TaxID=869212 RepID=I4B6V3_TURPD|nr:hypothetical protein [Turneriella parva]AFM13010.1 hypothetical protein Turpa_2367 [Turneriella parva DSM 21527]